MGPEDLVELGGDGDADGPEATVCFLVRFRAPVASLEEDLVVRAVEVAAVDAQAFSVADVDFTVVDVELLGRVYFAYAKKYVS